VTEDLQIACPDAEDLAEYVEGRLSGGARARVEAHLADCEMCRDVVAETLRLGGEAVGAGTVLPFWRRPKVRAIGGGVLALAASLLLLVQVQPQLNPFRAPTPYEALVASVGSTRTIEPRLSGGFAYAPLAAVTRGGGESPSSTDFQKRAAEAELRNRANADPTPFNLHRWGVGLVMLGDFDNAITQLDRAAAGLSEEAAIQNDLAAAYLARSRAEGSADDSEKALAAADRAIALEPNSAEAHFNRALALEQLERRQPAVAAWRAYLGIEPNGGWAEEARRHVSELEAR
jgi:tetratricopeptide (TPR) repeat protein